MIFYEVLRNFFLNHLKNQGKIFLTYFRPNFTQSLGFPTGRGDAHDQRGVAVERLQQLRAEHQRPHRQEDDRRQEQGVHQRPTRHKRARSPSTNFAKK